MLVLAPTFALHGWPDTIDLDMFNVSLQFAFPYKITLKL